MIIAFFSLVLIQISKKIAPTFYSVASQECLGYLTSSTICEITDRIRLHWTKSVVISSSPLHSVCSKFVVCVFFSHSFRYVNRNENVKLLR